MPLRVPMAMRPPDMRVVGRRVEVEVEVEVTEVIILPPYPFHIVASPDHGEKNHNK